jgi:undecaprenyl phosphate N,N'-diacetylbacillosamine 1-phosphate transferase
LEDGGPVLFRQTRLGQYGRTIRILKLRTMRPNAGDLRNPDGSTYAGGDDPRITRVGRHLRRWSIDELPQLLNVLFGDLSLVGPRPDLPDQLRLYRPIDHRRLRVKPGLTGLAQISGRNALTWEQRRNLDLEYVARASSRLDAEIMLRTIPLLVTGHGTTQPAGPVADDPSRADARRQPWT